MPRPPIQRKVRGKPNSNYFKPAGIPLRELEEVCISLDEFEAIRLIEIKELSQQEAATQMHISQSTLSRILDSSRKKMADALIKGKAIKVEK